MIKPLSLNTSNKHKFTETIHPFLPYRWFLPSWMRKESPCRKVWSHCRLRSYHLAGSFQTSPEYKTGTKTDFSMSVRGGNVLSNLKCKHAASKPRPHKGILKRSCAMKEGWGRKRWMTVMMGWLWCSHSDEECTKEEEEQRLPPQQPPSLKNTFVQCISHTDGGLWSDGMEERKCLSEYTKECSEREVKCSTSSHSPATERVCGKIKCVR